ncbi:MAG TPA: response regulator [Stellaceae bacterium]|nr:response regulator [Stellaceae bacterium]
MDATGKSALLTTDRAELRPVTIEKTTRILIVEDDAMVATYIAEVLVESGFEVSGVASTGAEALMIAGIDGAHLALVDIKLSGPMDGIEVARELRTQHSIGAIFLSGLDDPAILQRAAVAQPLGFLQKPFLPSQVFNAINRALRQSTKLASRAPDFD